MTNFQVPTQGVTDPDQRRLKFPSITGTAPAQGQPNPVLDEIDRAHSQLSPPAQTAIAAARQSVTAPAQGANAMQSPAYTEGSAPAAPTIKPPAAAMPAVTPRPQSNAEQQYSDAVQSKAGIDRLSGAARIPLKILEAIGGATNLGRNIETFLPGTELHHSMDIARKQGAVNQELAGRKEASEEELQHAQTQNQEAIPALKQTAADLAASKANETATHNRATEDVNRAKNEGHNEATAATRKATLATHGFKEDEKGEIVPLEYSEMSEPQQGIHDLKAAQVEMTEASAALKKAQTANQPAAAALAQKRLQSAQDAHAIASRRLGLSEKQFEMHAHGTEGGEPLPGAMIGDDNKPVGTAFQANVRPTGTQRDAAGRADTMLDLDTRIRKALTNPEIAKGTGPLAGRLSEAEGRLGVLPKDLSELRNDLVSYGAFQAGLHPVRGIGALQYFDKVMGGLGQNPEELIGKLDSNKATANSAKRVGSPRTVGSNQAGAPSTQGKPEEYVRNAQGKLVPKGPQ
jgi:hypothetical protein